MKEKDQSGFALMQLAAPALLASLRDEFPDHKARFEAKGVTLGGDVERVDAAGCLAALQVSLAVCASAIKEGEHLLSRTRRLVLASSILTAVSSAGLLTVIAANAPKLVEYVVAVITLISGCLTIVAEHFAHGTGGGQVDLAYRSLAELFPQVVAAHARLTGYLKIEQWQTETVPAVKALIESGHELCGKVQAAAATIGVIALPQEQIDALAAALPDKSAVIPTAPSSKLPALKPVDSKG